MFSGGLGSYLLWYGWHRETTGYLFLYHIDNFIKPWVYTDIFNSNQLGFLSIFVTPFSGSEKPALLSVIYLTYILYTEVYSVYNPQSYPQSCPFPSQGYPPHSIWVLVLVLGTFSIPAGLSWPTLGHSPHRKLPHILWAVTPYTESPSHPDILLTQFSTPCILPSQMSSPFCLGLDPLCQAPSFMGVILTFLSYDICSGLCFCVNIQTPTPYGRLPLTGMSSHLSRALTSYPGLPLWVDTYLTLTLLQNPTLDPHGSPMLVEGGGGTSMTFSRTWLSMVDTST